MPAYKMRRYNKLNAHIEEEEAKAYNAATSGGAPPTTSDLDEGFVGKA